MGHLGESRTWTFSELNSINQPVVPETIGSLNQHLLEPDQFTGPSRGSHFHRERGAMNGCGPAVGGDLFACKMRPESLQGRNQGLRIRPGLAEDSREERSK